MSLNAILDIIAIIHANMAYVLPSINVSDFKEKIDIIDIIDIICIIVK
jgi:hypothetical protein